MAYYIGLDIGTGSTKAIAVDSNTKETIATAHASYPTLTPLPYYSEQDPHMIWEAAVQTLRTIIQQHGAPMAIGLSSAMHSLILVDESGTPLMNMMTWADGRAADIANTLHAATDAKQLYEATGMPIHAMSPLCKIMWLHEHEPLIFQKAYKFISIKEFIWYKLFHTFEIDHSIAAASGLYAISKHEWYDNALTLGNITAEKLSTLVATNHARIITDENILTTLALSTPTLVVIGASDGCLANLGSQAMLPGRAALTIGTSGAIRVAGSAPRHNFNAMIFNYPLDDDTFISGGAVNNGGAILQWFIRDILKHAVDDSDDYQALMQSMTREPGAEGLLFIPYLLGERAPVWNSKTCGVFFGLTIEHTQGHMIRAVMEGITMNLLAVGRVLEDAGSIDVIYASGGFTKSPAWLQILADMFNKKIILQNAEDASALGAVMMAMKKIEGLSIYPNLTNTDERKEVLPNETNHRYYIKRLPTFMRIYELLKDEMGKRWGEE